VIEASQPVVENRIAVDLAVDLADQPAEPGAQEPQLALCPLELVDVGARPAMTVRPLATLR
jgi:hypothetical protein